MMSVHPANRAGFRRAAVIAGVAAGLLLVIALLPAPLYLLGSGGALSLHIMLETAAVAFALLLFAVSWNAFGAQQGGLASLGCGLFLAVALLDFAHLLAYPGMPDFVTPAQLNKALFFYLCARVTAVAAMLCFVLSPAQWAGRVRQRNFGMVVSLAAAGGLLWLGLLHPQALPLLDGSGGTLLRDSTQLFVLACDLALAAAFVARARGPLGYPVGTLFCACLLMALSEIAFLTSGRAFDALNVLAHLLKVTAYYLLYRTLFVRAIRLPFELLAQSDAGLRDSEERFRVLFETTTDVVLMMTADSVIRYANPAVRMLGYEPHELEGRPLAMLQPEPLREAHRKGVERYLATGQKKLNWRATEAAALHRDGRVIPIEVAFSAPLFGGTQYFVGFMRDITERKNAQEKILELNAGLEQRVAERTEDLAASVREMEAFSYSVSHDLRAPLRGIAGFASLVLSDHGKALDESGRGYLTRITEAAERMGRMIDALLELSRIGRKPLQLVEIDLSALARQVAAEIDEGVQANSGQEGGASGTTQTPAQWEVADGLVARADPILMRIVLENLLGNARKFCPREGGRIEFGATVLGTATVYHVRDNGVGFDMAYASKLFKVFERLHPAEQYPGTGIGLATVQRIVQDHGGRVWAESAPGRGATFYFTLAPVERPPGREPEAAPREAVTK